MNETIDDIESTGSTPHEQPEATPQESDTVDTPENPEPETQPEGEPAGEEEPEQPAEDENAKKQPKNGVQGRISELVEQRNAERAARLAAEQRLTQFEQPANQDAEPVIEQFESLDAYRDALSQYHQQQAQKQAAQTYQQLQAQAAFEHKTRQFESAEQEFAKTAPDYMRVAAQMGEIAGGELPAHITKTLLDSGDMAPAIAYELGKDANAFADFLSLPPERQLMRMGAIEDRLSQKKPAARNVVSKAPTPGKPANNGKTGGEISIDEMDGDEYLKHMDAKNQKK